MEPRSSHRNAETLAHEGIHQLSFNTGLLGRDRTSRSASWKGSACTARPAQVIGPSDLGRVNLRRLEELARIQRMVDWIPLRELFTDDTVLQAGKALRVLLGYAQSWLLVHYLMKEPEVHAEVPRLPRCPRQATRIRASDRRRPGPSG